MITIYVANEEEKKYAIEQMDRQLDYNENLSGAEYEVEITADSGKLWSIDNIDEIVGAELMGIVFKKESLEDDE